jgi:hypothetical protein
LAVVSVVVQNRAGELSKPVDAGTWARELGLSFPVLADPTGSFFSQWDSRELLPYVYIVDRRGVIVYAEAGGQGGLSSLEAELEHHLRRAP